MRSGCWGACEGQALALRWPGVCFFVVRGPVPREAAIARDMARDRPSHYGCRGAFFFVVRGPVLRDRSLILAILAILAILIQTRRRHGGGQAPPYVKSRSLTVARGGLSPARDFFGSGERLALVPNVLE